MSIGSLVGALAAAPIADRIGRRYPVALASCIYAIGAVIQISNQKWFQVMIGRLIGGFGIGGLSVLVPLAISETSPTHNRGLFTS